MDELIRSATSQEPETWFVCVLGIAVVFLGLIFLIGIVYLMNLITEKLNAKNVTEQRAERPHASAEAAPVASGAPIENRQEILAAVCAAVAEENGTDISAIRVISFKKIQN